MHGSPRICIIERARDGCIGYLPTAQFHAEGGYEVDWAPFFYRYPARLAAQCAHIATDAAIGSLRGLWQPG